MSENSTTYNRILSKGIERDLPVNIGENKLRFTTDTGRLFLDNEGTNRIEITDFVKGLTKNQIINTIAPLPKVYLASDTHEMLVYDTTSEQWVNYGGRLEVIELTQAEYDQLTPEEKADPNKIYAVPGDGNYLKFQEISAEDYEALTEEEKMDPYTVYMTPGDGTYFRVVDITQEEYDQLTPEEQSDPQILYLISNDTEYLTTDDAASIYLTQSDATVTYATKSEVSDLNTWAHQGASSVDSILADFEARISALENR